MPAKCYEAPGNGDDSTGVGGRGENDPRMLADTEKSRGRQERCLFNPFVRRDRLTGFSRESRCARDVCEYVFVTGKADARSTSLPQYNARARARPGCTHFPRTKITGNIGTRMYAKALVNDEKDKLTMSNPDTRRDDALGEKSNYGRYKSYLRATER